MSDAGTDVNQLRAALEAAKRTAEAATHSAATERAARIQAETRVRGAEGTGWAAREQAADSAIQSITGEIDGLKRSHATLQAEGKFEEAADIAEKIGDATARRREQQNAKVYFGQQREQSSKAPADPLANYSPAQRSWIEAHPAYLNDPNYANRVNFLYEKGKQEASLAPDSPELFTYIEKNLNPQPAAAETKPAPRAEGGDTAPSGEADSPFSDTGEATDPPGEGGASGLQRHTMDAPPVNQTTDPPAMRIEIDTGEKPSEQTPQPKAAKGDGSAIRSVAAPPSRNINQFVARTNRTGRIEPTMEELNAARDLAAVIEPEIAAKGDTEIIKWYYAMAHHPSNLSTRRRSWARDSVVS